MSTWNLNRLLVIAGAASVLFALFAFAGWTVAGVLKVVPEAAPALPGFAFAILLAIYARPWVYLTAGILNCVLPLMVLFIFGGYTAIIEPISGFESQSILFLLLGLVLSLTGGIGGFVQGRRGAQTPLVGAMRSRTGLLTALFVVLVAGMFLASTLASAAVRAQASAGGAYDVVADQTVTLSTEDFQFSPRSIEVREGKLVEIAIANKDTGGHTFTYAVGGKTYDHPLPGGATTKVLVRFDGAQTIPFWCKPHSDGEGDTSPDSMTGTIVVA